MGKHERHEIEVFEKAIVELFNLGELAPRVAPGTKWDAFITPLLKVLLEEYRGCRATHIGNMYRPGLLGDIAFERNGKPVAFVEIKLSETSMGVGTLANVSQNILSQNVLNSRIPTEPLLGWSEWRIQSGFEKQVIQQLTDCLGRTLHSARAISRQKEDLWDALYREGKVNNKSHEWYGTSDSVQNVLQNIRNHAERDKLNYLSYLSRNSEAPGSRLAAVCIALVNGMHRKADLEKFVRVAEPSIANGDFQGQGAVPFVTIYGNIKNGAISVRSGTENGLKSIILGHRQLKLDLGDGIRQNAQILGPAGDCAITFQLHWGNKTQGVQNPRVNVFRGPALLG